MSAESHGTGVRETFLRTVAVVGLLAVLILGAWGIILLASYLPTAFQGWGDDNTYVVNPDDEGEFVDDEEEVVVVVPATPVKPSYTYPSQPSQPAVMYVPATQRAQLYGLPDLSVRVNSVSPIGGNRMSVQFAVQNVGSNTAPSGWMLNAQIPWQSSSYTYVSPSQRTLYPGDQIYYTLSFDRNIYDNRYDDDRNTNDECDVDDRDDWDEDDWQDWYDDDCGDEYCDNDWDTDYDRDEVEEFDEDDWQDWFDDYCDEDNGDDNDDDYRYGTYFGDRTVQITVDPQGRVYEVNRTNNTATAQVPVY